MKVLLFFGLLGFSFLEGWINYNLVSNLFVFDYIVIYL